MGREKTEGEEDRGKGNERREGRKERVGGEGRK